MTNANKYPFRLGCTSYVIPADIVPNVEFMAGKIDDMEIVLFESEKISNMPTVADVKRIGEIASVNQMSFTIHLPFDITAAAADKADRTEFVEHACRITELFDPIAPHSYVIHLAGHKDFETIRRQNIFVKRSTESLLSIVDKTGIDPKRLCIENLSYPWEFNLEISDKTGCSLCTDIGHLVMKKCRLDHSLSILMPRTRVVHLHGIHAGRDHRSLRWMKSDDRFVALVKEHLSKFVGVCTLEVFEEGDVFSSIETISEWYS